MAHGDPNRELTPALVRGGRGSVTVLEEGQLAPGLEGALCHHVFADGRARRESTLVLTSVPEGVAFAPALVCRDRAERGGGAPAQLPAERWESTELESTAFNRRFRLFTLKGQDPLYVRELFTPSLIAWLAHYVPAGFSFELNERHLVVAVPGHLDGEGLERLRGLAAEVRRRIREEAAEEGEGTGVFDESAKLAEIEAALDRASFAEPPSSVAAALDGYRRAARWKPRVVLTGLVWAAILATLAALFVTLLWNPVFGIGAALLALPTGFGIGRTIGASRYRWGDISVSRLGLERFLRGYADLRGLELEDRWRFHSRHRDLPLPGTASHVMAGPIPGAEPLEGLFVTLGDAAELRSRGIEVAHVSEQPLAAIAVVAELADEAAVEALRAVEMPDGLRLESAGTTLAIWRPVAGNLLFEAAGFDRFRATAGELLAGRRGPSPSP